MRQIPAKCGNCGYLFPSGYGVDPIDPDTGIDTGAEFNMTVQATAPVSTPCPMCGRQKGRVLSGEYNFVKDTITFLSGPESTKEDLERLLAFLRDAQRQGAAVEEIREKADREIPGLSRLIRELLANRPARMELAAWLALIVSTLAFLVSLKIIGSMEKPEPSQIIYEVNNYNVVQYPPSAGEEQYVVSNVGRNDPCPCGSGKKYKKCHGTPSIIQSQP